MNFTNYVVCSYVNQTLTSFGNPMTNISFEFFSSKTVTAAFLLQRATKKLSIFAPHFGSITCSQNPTQTLDTVAVVDKLALGPL